MSVAYDYMMSDGAVEPDSDYSAELCTMPVYSLVMDRDRILGVIQTVESPPMFNAIVTKDGKDESMEFPVDFGKELWVQFDEVERYIREVAL